MNIDGVEIRSLETKEQRDWFNNFKHDEMNRAGTLFSFSKENGSSSEFAIILSFCGFEFIEADGKIWAVEPDDYSKEIFVKSGTTHQHLPQEEGEDSNKVPERYLKGILYYHKPIEMDDAFGPVQAMGLTEAELDSVFIGSSEVRGHEDESERFNNMSVKDKQRYICQVPKLYKVVGDGRVFYSGETSGSSTKNMTYGRGETSGSSTENMNHGRGEVRGHLDQNHIPKNHFASDDEGNRFGEAAMKQNIDNKKVNDEHVVDMPKGVDHSDKKEQANDGLFRLCEIGLANIVSLMGSNPPPWAATPASQKLLGFSGAANAVGYVGTTAALSLRYTKPGAARIFANIGPISCAWGVIMGFTSYLPGEFQWLGYVAAVFCTLAVLFSNY